MYWCEHLGDNIRAADCRTGETIWSYSLNAGDNGMHSSPAITDGVMYIAATDGNLYAFGTGLKYSYHRSLSAVHYTNTLIAKAWAEDGSLIGSDTVKFDVAGVDVAETVLLPENRLWQNYPNPFNGQTRIKFDLLGSGTYRINIYDVRGQLIRTEFEKYLSAGMHEFNFNSEDLESGLYLYELAGGKINIVNKMLLIK